MIWSEVIRLLSDRADFEVEERVLLQAAEQKSKATSISAADRANAGRSIGSKRRERGLRALEDHIVII